MRLYDEKTPERLMVLAGQFLMFIISSVAMSSRGDILGLYLATAVIMAFIASPSLFFSASIREWAWYLALPGLLVVATLCLFISRAQYPLTIYHLLSLLLVVVMVFTAYVLSPSRRDWNDN